MAARIDRVHSERVRAWRFYVYALTDADGVAYIGKGSGRRLAAQRRAHRLDGHEVARFKREKDAYRFERECIAQYRPALNRHPGGNGSRATPIVVRKYAFEKEIEAVGSRRYCARLLLSLPLERFNESSKVDAIRSALQKVWDGPRC